MILVTWFCSRCGRKVRAKKFYNVQPMDAIDAHDEVCNDCMKEYEALRKRQKAEIDEFWKERTNGTAK